MCTENTAPCPETGQNVQHDNTTDRLLAGVPLVPQPLSDAYASDWRRLLAPGTHTGRPDPADPTDTIQLWGHCESFCDAVDAVRTDGLTVAEHGPWCRSLPIASVDVHDVATGRCLGLQAAAVRPYRHGTYHRADIWRSQGYAEVQLTLFDGDDCLQVVNLIVGDALRLAAGLTRAGEVADRRDLDFNAAKAERAADR